LAWTEQQQEFYFFGLNASKLVNTDTVRLGDGEKTLRSSRLSTPNHLSNTLSQGWAINLTPGPL